MLHSEHDDISPAVQVRQVKSHLGQNKRDPSSYQPALQAQKLEVGVIALLFTVGE